MGMADVYKNEKDRWEECKACAAEPLIIAASIGCLLLLLLASAAAAAARWRCLRFQKVGGPGRLIVGTGFGIVF